MNSTLEVREPDVQERIEWAAEAEPLQWDIRAKQRALFADVLLDTDERQCRRRMSAEAFSFVLQGILIGALLLVPLWYTDALPKQQLLTFLIAPPPPPPPPPSTPPVAPKAIRQVASDIVDGRLRTPSRIPERVRMIREEEVPPPVISGTGGVAGGVPGGIPGGQLGGVIGGIISSVPSTAAVPKLAQPTIPKRIRVSEGVTVGQLVQKPQPKYPLLAQQARIQGAVVLSARISANGEIENLELVSGHPMLAPAAIEAVRGWRYRPFLLNGQPVEVETRITVNFQLSQ